MRVFVQWPGPEAVAKRLSSRGHEVSFADDRAAPDIVLLDGARPGAAAEARAYVERGATVLALLPAPGAVSALLDAGADVAWPPLDDAALEARLRGVEALAAARAAGRLATERFEVLTEAAFEAIVVHAGAEILYCNRAGATLLGVSPDQIVGANFLEFAAPEDRERVLANSRSGYSKPYRVRALRRDGTIFPAEVRGRSVNQGGRDLRIVAFRDLTTEEAVERSKDALSRSEARLRQIIEEAPEAVAVVGLDGRYLFANRGVAAMRGFRSPEEVLGTSAADFLTPASRALFAERTRALFEGRIRPGPAEYEFRIGDGPVRSAEVVSLPIEFEGRPALLAFVRDVTDRRQMEAHLRQSERMASLGMLAAGVAHEINNPLAFVTANLEFAAARSAGHPEIARALADAKEGAARVARIVRDLRVYARAEEEPPAAVDVREPLRFALAVTEVELRHRARVVTEFGETPPVLAPEGRLGQVFVDLLTNAAHAIPEGDAGQNEIRVTAKRDGDRVAVVISDTGCGIPAANLPRLFEPFFTTKPPGRGTGLGLFTCHGIVRALGGEIAVESEPGKGTRVTVRLPAGAPAAARPAPGTGVPSRAPGRRRVLIVDDEPDLGTALTRLLEPEHEVTFEQEAEAALARLRRGEAFDAILCDLMMPRMTGMDLHAALATDVPAQAARMVFLTGGAFTARSQEFLEGIGLPRLDKPFEVADLLRAIETAARVKDRS